QSKDIELYFDSPTNQQVPCLTDEQMAKLGEEFAYCYWCKSGDKHVVRFCTSWATKEEDVDKLIEALERL
ncbi:MAG: low specificity L-threonine aldolase, partial [Clostridia bacterium]|nr:low specificity L-threonine aldolase [Clostridia bacterium]